MKNYHGNLSSEDKDQRLVTTPYGKGLVIRTRKSKNGTEGIDNKNCEIQEVRLLAWDNAMLYSCSNFPSITPEVGYDVITQYGRGIITDIIAPSINDEKNLDDEQKEHAILETLPLKYIITLTSWRLANRSLIKCYLTRSAFSVVRKKYRHEMDAYDKVTFAQNKKKEAAIQFSKMDYSAALNSYTEAVNYVRYVQHDANSSNELRADLLEVMVTCNNNAATCCIKLKHWADAKRFANNALILLDALYNKRGMKIHSIMNADGLTDTKLFGEWKGKSSVIVAKALMNMQDHEQAIQWLKKAKSSIKPYFVNKNKKNDDSDEAIEMEKNQDSSASQTILSSMSKEINRLMHTAMQKKKAVDKKEKLRAQAMFGGPTSSSMSKNKSRVTALESSMPNEVKSNHDIDNLDPSDDSEESMTGAGKVQKESQAKTGLTHAEDSTQVNDETDQSVRPSILKRPSFTGTPGSPNRVSSPSPQNIPINANTRRVKFEEVNHYDKPDDEEEPWYQEHKEALVLAGLFLTAGATFFLRPRK